MTGVYLEMKFLLFLVNFLVFAEIVVSQPDEGIIDVRLTDQNSKHGGVEVLFKESTSSDSVWLPVCREPNHDTDRIWGKTATTVLCTQLGQVGGWPYTYPNVAGGGKGIDDFRCYGDEDYLWECGYDGETFIDREDTHCGSNNQAGVKCYGSAEIRLTNSPTTSPNQGIVEVKYDVIDGDWMEICYSGNEASDEDWTKQNADVVCNQLGYPGAMITRAGDREPESQIQAIDDVTCNVGETSFVHCTSDEPESSSCADDNKVEVICFLPGYEGCFLLDDTTLLPVFGAEDSQMTIVRCLDICHQKGHNYAGVTMGSICRCGTMDNVDGVGGQRLDEECSEPCGGNEDLFCGGDGRISIYRADQNTCEDPGVPSNSERSGDSFVYGSLVKYECSANHELIGQSTIQCIMGNLTNTAPDTVRWNSSVPICRALPTEITSSKTDAVTQLPNLVGGLADNSLDTGIVVGIAAASFALILLIIAALCFVLWRRKAVTKEAHQNNIAPIGEMNSMPPRTDQVIQNPYFDPSMPAGASGYDPEYEDIGFKKPEKDSGIGLSVNVAAGASDYESSLMFSNPSNGNVYT